ncbi:MAG: Alternative cytochrome c oxidase subunit 2 [Alphaproteobacteria bacterium MarineAlpha3_Bin5]|nr:cytochrome-c oxidase [Magnetovibrio sp.]PPR78492.1 MAG: Alternative cytochrome c oxidase subunit 2 [Alphaproteobacteria bacterium MarineAlpha3_Bin5]
MIVAYAILLVGIGTVVFHFVSPWWWTPIASNWGFIDDVIIITFWVTGVVFVAVVLFMAYCVYRFRYKEGQRAEYNPESKKLEIWLSVLTSVGVAIMLAPGLWAWDEFVTVPEGTAEFEVLGQQWSWMYRFPGKDGKLGKSSTKLIDDDNPFGLDPKDPNGQDDVLIEDSELHLPLNKPVKVLLRSVDVLHDFYVPELRAKMDMVPGAVTYLWFEPIRVGTFDILCFELCGTGHYDMRGSLVIEEADAFNEWFEAQSTFAETLARISPEGEIEHKIAANAAENSF